MAYNPKYWGTDELITSGKLNQCKETFDWLYGRLPFLVQGNCVALQNLVGYIIDANIFPGNANGTGSYGLTWNRVQGGANESYIIVQFIVPNTVFSGTPYIVGLTVGAGDYPWLIPTARYGESATGFYQRFGMTDHPPSKLGYGHFHVAGLLIGPRKLSPS